MKFLSTSDHDCPLADPLTAVGIDPTETLVSVLYVNRSKSVTATKEELCPPSTYPHLMKETSLHRHFWIAKEAPLVDLVSVEKLRTSIEVYNVETCRYRPP